MPRSALSICLWLHFSLVTQLQLDENKSNASRTSELEQEVKEKNLLIGKLRHEGVSSVSLLYYPC